jgi:hypothetical protein
MTHIKDKRGKKEVIQSFRSVSLPHLRAEVHFMDLSKLKGIPIMGSAYTCIMGGEKEDMSLDICIFYEQIEKSIKRIECMPMICHEIIHALQILCEQRIMVIEEEKEHLAYITSYLLENLLLPIPNKNKEVK